MWLSTKLLRDVARRSGTEGMNDASGERRESSEMDLEFSLKHGSSLRGVCCITLDLA